MELIADDNIKHGEENVLKLPTNEKIKSVDEDIQNKKDCVIILNK